MKYRGTIAYRTGLGGNVPEGFLASVVPAWDFLTHEIDTITEYGKGTPERVHFMRGMSCMLHDSANQIAEGFLGDWVLFLDTDHVFKSDAFYNMVSTFEDGLPDGSQIDILTGFTQKRQPPYTPVIQKTNFDPLLNFEPIIPDAIQRHTLISVDAAGLACLMVRRRVFDKIKDMGEKPFDFRPKFQPSRIPMTTEENETYTAMEYFGKCADYDFKLPPDRRSDEFYWEDISFFWRAALLGFKAYCAPWIKFHHIETRLVTDDMMQLEKESPIPK